MSVSHTPRTDANALAAPTGRPHSAHRRVICRRVGRASRMTSGGSTSLGRLDVLSAFDGHSHHRAVLGNRVGSVACGGGVAVHWCAVRSASLRSSPQAHSSRCGMGLRMWSGVPGGYAIGSGMTRLSSTSRSDVQSTTKHGRWVGA
jgi:hypothetical protein